MKRFTLFNYTIIISFLLFNTLCFSQGEIKDYGIENIIVDAIPVDATIAAGNADLDENAVCYRIFIDFNPGYGVSTITGINAVEEEIYFPAYPLEIETTTEFFNSQFGSTTGEDILEALFTVDPALIYDSYVCFGGMSTGNRIGVPSNLDEDGYVVSGTVYETTLTPGFDLSMFGSSNSSVKLSTTNASWGSVVSGGAKGPVETDSTIVMIGQFTTTGELRFKLNINMTKKVGAGNHLHFYTATNKWFKNNDITNPYIQYSLLDNVYGPDIIHPEVSIPFEDTIAIIKTPFLLKANVDDSDGTVDSVEFRINNELLYVDDMPPYEYSWTPPSVGGLKSYVKYFSAIAIDNDGAASQSTHVKITVRDSSLINFLPEVRITSPAQNTIFNVDSILDIQVETSDVDGYVDSLFLLVNNVKVDNADTVINNNLIFQWSPANTGTYEIQVIALDNDGASKSSNTVIVVAGVAPNISITSPGISDTIYTDETVQITADASDDDGTIVKVEFYVNNNLIGSDDTAPYEMDWVPDTEGIYLLKATAIDNDSIISTSDVVNVNVENPEAISIITERHYIKLFPNPVHEFITFEIKSKDIIEKGKLRIINIDGSVIHLEEIESNLKYIRKQIPVSSLAPGIYVLELELNNKQYHKTFIKR